MFCVRILPAVYVRTWYVLCAHSTGSVRMLAYILDLHAYFLLKTAFDVHLNISSLFHEYFRF
jgi:hypothetical protein